MVAMQKAMHKMILVAGISQHKKGSHKKKRCKLEAVTNTSNPTFIFSIYLKKKEKKSLAEIPFSTEIANSWVIAACTPQGSILILA